MRKARTIAAAVAAAGLLVGGNVYAGPVSYKGGSYIESFDSLSWVTQYASTTWIDGSTLPGWYASPVSFLRGSGQSLPVNVGALFAFGNGTDVALTSKLGRTRIDWDLPKLYFGARIVNDMGSLLTEFTLSYVGEQWTVSGNQVEQLSFDYAVDATSLIAGSYVSVPELDFQSPYGNPTGTLGEPLDGNHGDYRRALTATIRGIEWLPGESLWLRWTDFDDPDREQYNHALGVDDLVFTATGPLPPAPVVNEFTAIQPASVPEPSSAALAALSMLTLSILLRRTSKQRS